MKQSMWWIQAWTRMIAALFLSIPYISIIQMDNYENAVLNLNQACKVEAVVSIMVKSILGMSTLAIYNKLSEGFYLSWNYSQSYELPLWFDVIVGLSSIGLYVGTKLETNAKLRAKIVKLKIKMNQCATKGKDSAKSANMESRGIGMQKEETLLYQILF